MEQTTQNITLNALAGRLDAITAKLDTLERFVLLNNKSMLNTDEAAKYIGLSKDRLYSLTSQRQIPCYKNGGKRTFYAKSDLDEWMRGTRRASQEEIDNTALAYEL